MVQFDASKNLQLSAQYPLGASHARCVVMFRVFSNAYRSIT
jgi:hypothetical protein